MDLAGSILIVDDNEDDLLLLKRTFRKLGILNPVFTLRSGKEAIEYMKGRGKYEDREQYPFPSILLLDLQMPGISGFDVLQWVRDKGPTKDLLVIVLSQLDDIKNINRAYALGANSFLTKPSDPAELHELMQTFKGYWLLQNRPPHPRAPE